jgi:hypothetical protein
MKGTFQKEKLDKIGKNFLSQLQGEWVFITLVTNKHKYTNVMQVLEMAVKPTC